MVTLSASQLLIAFCLTLAIGLICGYGLNDK